MTFPRTISLAVLLCAALAGGCAAPVAEKYAVHEDRLDSRFGHDPVTSDIPVDKRYDELTDAQRAVFRARYRDMGPDYEPPFPVDGQLKIFQDVRKLQAAAQLRGKFAALLTVDDKGRAHSIKIVQTPDEKINQPMAVILMKNTDYKPARCAGKPCTMDFVFEMTLDVAGTEAGEHRGPQR
jgi:hypothetical protein